MKRQFAFIGLAALAVTGCSTAATPVEDPAITPTPESVEITVPPSPHRIIVEGPLEDPKWDPPTSFKASDLTILREGVDPNALTEEELGALWRVQEMVNDAAQANIDARKAAQ